MLKPRSPGELERQVMDHLWRAGEPQTVRQVHAAVSVSGALAYNTVMTVLRRLADKGAVRRYHDVRKYRYSPLYGREEMVAGLMVDALGHAAGFADRRAALVNFVEHIGEEDLCALRRALAELDVNCQRREHAGWAAGLSR
ncbi:CopY family transcriptional regulator [Mycobacterium lentiflavum]|uniref:CopY family transcriptional regulator n=1 Tax=Mycobacterium lentiflavum TaxID=141349 RepID=A0A0E4CR60_MYCLN|nr:BlaI/MecI/CopY family transcriptional regulator [Mycobacterium lentiflavum]CQD22931.1 CopY family transcriptional regulator [Mycobacterium lentiflavum]